MYKAFCDVCGKAIENPNNVREINYRWALTGNVGHEAKAVVDKACLKRLNGLIQETVPSMKIAKDV